MTEAHVQFAGLQEALGYRFKDMSLLRKAMTHSSLKPAGYSSYERLEFLGDAVAGLIVAQRLFQWPERYSEGEMTEMKSAAVNRRSMARAGGRLKLESYLRTDPALEQSGRYPTSLIANAYEALIGAVFLDGGLEKAREVVVRTLEPELKAAERRAHNHNFKSLLQRLVQGDGHELPAYRTARAVGPQHDQRFQAVVRVGGAERGSGWGKTKKDAEQEAARQALGSLYPDWQQ